MIIKNKRNSKYILDLENVTTNRIDKVFIKMHKGFLSIAEKTLLKNGASPLDILIALGFQEIEKILEDVTISTYAFAYKNIFDGLDSEVNLDKVNKQALKLINERKEFTKAMEMYTKEKLLGSLEQALLGNKSYEEYLKDSEGIFVLDKKRARRIAVNEIGEVYVKATTYAIKDIQMETDAKVKKRWNNVGDGKVTRGCKYNENLGYVHIDYLYENLDGKGSAVQPPRFVGCRCALDYDVE